MLRLLLALTWLVGSLAWVQADHLLRDGDEEGHVGAAELFAEQLRQGRPGAFLQDAWMGDLGEYPPLYPAVVGGWWWLTGAGDPGQLPVRGMGLLSLLITAWALSAIAGRREGVKGWSGRAPLGAAEAAQTAAFLFVLCLPLANGLARHFMPEAPLMAAVALSVWAAVSASDRPTPSRAALLGLTLGLGLLVKQTFVIYALLPVLVAMGRPRVEWLFTLLVTAAVAGPWYLRHLPQQLAYGTSSAASASQATPLEHLAYYPLVLLWSGWGPVLCCLALGALGLALLRGARSDVLIGLAWLLGGLLLLILLPKKYPRLLLPLLPAAALWVGAAAARSKAPRLQLALWTLPAVAWLVFASVVQVPPPRLVEELDPGCTQTWLRPAHGSDLGISEVIAAVSGAPEGPVALLGADPGTGAVDQPQIPCALQTTHPWASHLGPALRRAGQERELIEGPSSRAALRLRWYPADRQPPAGATLVLVPELELVLAIEVAS